MCPNPKHFREKLICCSGTTSLPIPFPENVKLTEILIAKNSSGHTTHLGYRTNKSPPKWLVKRLPAYMHLQLSEKIILLPQRFTQLFDWSSYTIFFSFLYLLYSTIGYATNSSGIVVEEEIIPIALLY